MRLPHDLLNQETYTKPRIFLCEVDKEKICQLDTTETKASLKFNSYSELTFNIGRTYNNMLTGETQVFPYYDKIETPRLIFVETFGYFEIQDVEISSDGVQESKNVTAYSLEYTLSTKYLENFYVQTGELDSVEVIYAEDVLGDAYGYVPTVTLYNPENTKLSLLHLVLERAYGWSIAHVDTSLQTLSRTIEADRESVYDYIMNEICEKFNCYAVFDTVNNTVSLYAESRTARFIGDGETTVFTISPPFDNIKTVSIDGAKTTRYEYNIGTGTLEITETNAPESGAVIEVVDNSLDDWETDVFITFDNLAKKANVSYSADNIKTKLAITFGDNYDISDVNLGQTYITDLSYYYTPDWMGQDLYGAYTIYLQKMNQSQNTYSDNSQKMLEIYNLIDAEKNRTSTGYGIALSVNSLTVGTYYVRSGTSPNYIYTEISLPDDYNANTTYYSMGVVNVEPGNDGNVTALFSTLQSYFYNFYNWRNGTQEEILDGFKKEMQTALNEIQGLDNRFQFMEKYTINGLYNVLSDDDSTDVSKENYISNFFDEMWEELGENILKGSFYDTYKTIQIKSIEAGWSQQDNEGYGYYYVTILVLNSIEKAIEKRSKKISEYEAQYNALQQENIDIVNSLSMEKIFTEGQLVRLNAFLREDELQLDDILITSTDSITDIFKAEQNALESGRIELSKICQPQLSFSMDMANIYALPEFEPIIDQFQLGKVIKVGLRPDYIKQSRLLQVDINFDDFSDFSVEFGELTNLRTQSDIHADLLKKAVQAGKTVASSANIWQSGADRATATDLKIQQGLLDAVTQIKAIDGTQGALIDKYGIRLQKQLEDGSIDPEQMWLVNNQFVFTDDNFKTSRSALGKVTVDGQTYYGLISEIVLSGYIEGSKMKGGTIQIGEQTDGSYAFEVHEDGSVTMNSSGSSIAGYAKEEYVNGKIQEVKTQVGDINAAKMYRVEIITEDPTIISTSSDKATMICKVYSWDTDITDTLDASIFNWKRSSTNSEQDEIWNAMPEHQGVKSITIDADDVFENSSFTCEVDLPE